MPKILVLYYSTYGHIETMSGAIAEGARGVAGTEVTVKRVPSRDSASITAGSCRSLSVDRSIATAKYSPAGTFGMLNAPFRPARADFTRRGLMPFATHDRCANGKITIIVSDKSVSLGELTVPETAAI